MHAWSEKCLAWVMKRQDIARQQEVRSSTMTGKGAIKGYLRGH